MNKRKIFTELIKEICIDENIDVQTFSYDWVFRLNKDGVFKYIIGYNFDLNSSSVDRLCTDKVAASYVLSSHKISNVEHYFFANTLNFNKDSNSANFPKLLKKLNHYKKLVCKYNNGSSGNLVYLVANEKELEVATNKIFEHEDFMAVSPYYEIKNEYRVVVLNGKARLIYAKKRPYVIGDGKSSISKLILDYLYINNHLEVNLNLDDLTNFEILKKGKVFNLMWKHNLGMGATPEIVTDAKVIEKLESISSDVSNKLNIKFASIDIIDVNNSYKVLEINSGVMMDNFSTFDNENYDIVKGIYRDAILEMFDQR